MRITFLLTWADAMGGTERTILRQANWLAQQHDVEVIGVFRTRDTPAFDVDPRVSLRFLVDSRGPVARPVGRELDDEVCRILAATPSRLVKPEWEAAFTALTDLELSNALRETTTDILVSTTPALMALVATLAPRRVVTVHQEHRVAELRASSGDPYAVHAARMDAIALLSERTREWFAARLGQASPRLAVVPNAVESGYRPRSSRMGRMVMMAGRFTAEKQFDHAVAAFAQIVPEHPDWRLRIFGDGLRGSVERQITALRMGDHVELMGASFNLDQEWSKASVALLTSRVESFGLTLLEAAAAGVPAVAYDCPNGPREIIEDGVNGYLVPPDNVDELAAGLRKLIEDTELRHDMGERALQAVDRFSVETVMPKWEALFTELLAGRDGDGWADRRSAAQALQWAQEAESVVFIAPPPQLPPDAEAWAARVQVAENGLVWSHGQLTRLRDDRTPAEIAQLNLDLVVGVLDRIGAGHFLVRQTHPTFRVAVEADDRETVLGALAEAFADRPAYIEALDAQGRSRGAVPAALGPYVDKIRLAPSVRIFEPVLTTTQTLRMGAEYGCRIEFWTKSENGRDLEAPLGTLAGNRLARASMTPATLSIGDREYRTVEPFTRTLGREFVAPVDVVYTWVDGGDPEWLRRKAATLGLEHVDVGAEQGTERFRSRNELMYSLRSIDTFAPWVNRIWIVTDAQTPDWLDLDHPKVRVVDHRDIFDDPSLLPTFNSHAIETQLHHIEGLAEHFIYLNDDVFFGRLVGPDMFFGEGGLPKAFPSPTTVPLTPVSPSDEIFASAAKNNRALLEKAYGRTLTHTFLHAPHAFRRSTLRDIEREFADAVRHTAAQRIRTREDISLLSSLAHHYGIMNGRTLEGTIRSAFVNVGLEAQLPKLQGLLQRRFYESICLNDYHDGDVPADDQHRIMEAFLDAYFPIPSQFERGSARNRAIVARVPV